MAYKVGRSTVTGTGSKTLNTNLTGAPTWCRITTVDATYQSNGFADGSVQDCIWTSSTGGSNNSSIAHLENSGGTILFEATWTSFGTSGGSGTVVINVTTSSVARPIILEVGN